VMLPKTSEQGAVALQTQQLGAGVRLEKTDPEAIRAAFYQVLTNPKFRENAKNIGEGFRNCSGPGGAADKIEKVCGHN